MKSPRITVYDHVCAFMELQMRMWNLLQAFSMDGTVKLQGSETVHSTPFAEALPATADDASASIYQLIPCGQDAGESMALPLFEAA